MITTVLSYISAGHCPPPPLVKNTFLILADGFVADYQCLHGFRFPEGNTSHRIHCQNDTTWSEAPRPCSGMLFW